MLCPGQTDYVHYMASDKRPGALFYAVKMTWLSSACEQVVLADIDM